MSKVSKNSPKGWIGVEVYPPFFSLKFQRVEASGWKRWYFFILKKIFFSSNYIYD